LANDGRDANAKLAGTKLVDVLRVLEERHTRRVASVTGDQLRKLAALDDLAEGRPRDVDIDLLPVEVGADDLGMRT
jgi:hypothetical protein